MKIIPAIDIIGGKCVRLTKGDYKKMVTYADDPVEVAMMFESHGIQNLHVVDLDGAKSNHVINLDVLKRITDNTKLAVDFGGGVKSDYDIKNVFNAGATMVTGGSIAVKDPDTFKEWLKVYGPDKIILGADVKENKIAVSGWKETSDIEIFSFIGSFTKLSIKYVICTDIEQDGMLTGPSIDLYKELLKEFPGIRLIASGGVSSIEDVDKLAELGVWGTIIGKAFYEGRIKLEDLKEYI